MQAAGSAAPAANDPARAVDSRSRPGAIWVAAAGSPAPFALWQQARIPTGLRKSDTARMKPAGSLPTLDTPRLRLRQLHAGDVAELFAIFSDPAVTRYWSHAPFRSVEQAEEYLCGIDTGRVNGTHLAWGVALHEGDRVIGTSTLFSLNPKHRRAEIGYALLSTHWRRGFAREALCALIGHAFSTLGYLRLEADVDPRNVASCRLQETLGFRQEGELRERWHVEGEIQDSAVYGLLAREFIAAR